MNIHVAACFVFIFSLMTHPDWVLAQDRQLSPGDTLILDPAGVPIRYYEISDAEERGRRVGAFNSSNAGEEIIFLGWRHPLMLFQYDGETYYGDVPSLSYKVPRDIRKAEAAERAYQARYDELRAAGIPLLIHGISYRVNSAGGVEPVSEFVNISDERVKYVTIQIVGFNAVGDPVHDSVSRRTQHTLRLVGPIDPQESASYSFRDNPLFYTRTLHCIEVRRVEVEFMTGHKFTMVNDLVRARMNRDSYNVRGECAVD